MAHLQGVGTRSNAGRLGSLGLVRQGLHFETDAAKLLFYCVKNEMRRRQGAPIGLFC